MEQDAKKLFEGLDEQWRSLTFSNDFVFGKVMLDSDICREVLEAILDKPIERIEYVGRQDELDETPAGKGVRLDAYIRDGQGTVYNVEMQTTNTRELPQRSRYYHAMLTFDQLGKGERYRELKGAYVIFICGFDLFGKGRRVYSFQNLCEGDEGLALGDGTHTIFLASTSPEEEGRGARVNELLDYVADGTVTGNLSSKIDDAVERVRDNRKWRLEFMSQAIKDQLNVDKGRELGLEEGRRLGLEEGRKKGLEEGRRSGLEEGRRSGLEEGRQAGIAEGRKAGIAEGRQAGLEEGRQAGIAEGRKEGETAGMRRGEDRLAALVARLLADGRTDDVSGVVSDARLRERLYAEYGLDE